MLLSIDHSDVNGQIERKVEATFNSYVFVQLSDADRNLFFQSLGVVRYLFWLGKAAIVRDEEIDTIKKWLSTRAI
jgi:hypothetical protein